MTATREAQLLRKLESKEYRDGFVAADISCTLAAQLFNLRTARGWTQRQLAEAAGMVQTRISELEDPSYSRHSVATLKRLASALDVGLSVRFVPLDQQVRLAIRPDPLISTKIRAKRTPKPYDMGETETIENLGGREFRHGAVYAAASPTSQVRRVFLGVLGDDADRYFVQFANQAGKVRKIRSYAWRRWAGEVCA